MSLREWDRKAKITENDIKNMQKICLTFEDKDSQKLLSQQQIQLKQQNHLEQNLGYLLSVSTRRRFLSEKERAILHWAQEFAKKTNTLYRRAHDIWHEKLWARLVQLRSTSIAKENISYIQQKNRKNDYHIQLLEIRENMKKQLKSCKKTRVSYSLRYENILISKANRKASATPSVIPRLSSHFSKNFCQFQKKLASIEIKPEREIPALSLSIMPSLSEEGFQKNGPSLNLSVEI